MPERAPVQRLPRSCVGLDEKGERVALLQRKWGYIPIPLGRVREGTPSRFAKGLYDADEPGEHPGDTYA